MDISGNTLDHRRVRDESVRNEDQGLGLHLERSGGIWSQEEKLTADDGEPERLFGYAVTIDGDTAIVGAAFDDTGANEYQGAAYVFVRSDGTWSQMQKLTASDGAAGVLFGASVALDAETAVIGAAGNVEGGATGAGAAYVYTLTGATWTEQQKLLPTTARQETFSASP